MSYPNIVYIHSHDTGRYIEPYGHAVSTPHMQALAEEGVLFRQCFAAGPTCSPSRAGLLTGMAPHSCGMLGLAHRGWGLNDYKQHMIHTLRDAAGYTSALVGVQHIAKSTVKDLGAKAIGYDEILEMKSSGTADIANAACEYLRRGHDQPFFLSVGFEDTHRDFGEPGSGDDPRYILPPAPLPDSPQIRKDMAAFKTSARRYDDGVGRVMRELRDQGLEESTLVINTTDHGIAFPGMKCTLTDHGIGVMLIMRGPGGFTGGKAVDGMVSQVDIFPTLCDLLGIAPPVWLQGRSFLPLVRGETEAVNEEIFSEVTYHGAYEPQRCVRTTRWKYIKRFGDRATGVMPNCDKGLSKSELLTYGLRERPVAREQLYDLVFDPNEACNLAALPEFADILGEMRSRLEAWMRRTDDPLLYGDVTLSDCGVTTDVDEMDANGRMYNNKGQRVDWQGTVLPIPEDSIV